MIYKLAARIDDEMKKTKHPSKFLSSDAISRTGKSKDSLDRTINNYNHIEKLYNGQKHLINKNRKAGLNEYNRVEQAKRLGSKTSTTAHKASREGIAALKQIRQANYDNPNAAANRKKVLSMKVEQHKTPLKMAAGLFPKVKKKASGLFGMVGTILKHRV